MNALNDNADTKASHLPGLIERCLRDEVDAFRQLVEEHQNYVYSVAFRILHDEDDARDVAQETFIRVWRHLPSYKRQMRFTTWLYTIAVNQAYDLLKMNTRRRRWLLRSDSGENHAPAGAPVEEMTIVNRDLAARIKELAAGLPPKQRLVFALRDLQDLSIDEVARVLSMSTGAVKTNLCFARRFIRARMERLEGTMEGRP